MARAGIYFWVDSQERGLRWAEDQSQCKGSKITDPYVIGAYVLPGLCLNLTDFGVMNELRDAYRVLSKLMRSSGVPLPTNTVQKDGVFLRRALDCAVINAVHQLRDDKGEPKYETVYGVFDEGAPLFPGSGFREKTHVQIAVVNPDCILGHTTK